MAVVVSKNNAALNTMVRSNAVNAFCLVVHGLNRTIKNAIIKYFNTIFSVLRYVGATDAMPKSATAYNAYDAYIMP